MSEHKTDPRCGEHYDYCTCDDDSDSDSDDDCDEDLWDVEIPSTCERCILWYSMATDSPPCGACPVAEPESPSEPSDYEPPVPEDDLPF